MQDWDVVPSVSSHAFLLEVLGFERCEIVAMPNEIGR